MIRWVASYPKSGNTWVRLFLGAYIGNPKEFDPNKRLRGHLQDTDPGYLNRVSPKPAEKLSRAEAYACRGAALVHMIHDHGTPYVKTHCANITLDFQENLIPVALSEKSIYIMRDPRDVAVSYADHAGKSIDQTITDMADPKNLAVMSDDTGPQPMTSWSFHVDSWARKMPFQIFIARYEDLLADPAMSFHAMLDFLEIEFKRERFNRAMTRTNFAALARREADDGFSAKSVHQEKFFRSGKVGGWRGKLTSKQIGRIESDHGPTMETWRYLGA